MIKNKILGTSFLITTQTNMFNKFKTLLISLTLMLFSCGSHEKEISVLQFNIWSEGTSVENGFDAIVDNIINVNPDFVTFSEVRNYNDVDFTAHIVKELEKKGSTFYGEPSESTGIISKYPIVKQTVIYPYVNDEGSILKATINIGKNTVALYSAHLDFRHYACYLPRSYSGATWEKLEEPITNPDSILVANRKSRRLEAIEKFISDAKNEIQKEHIVILGGDLNEPSHLDWQEDTKHLWDHNGAVVEWDCSKALYNNNFKDAYRELYADAVNYPGFTFPSDNIDAEVSKLTWAPDADERERIDFIYFYPSQNITLKDAVIVGPSSSIIRSKRKKEESKDKFILPYGIWPTDHKAVLATFIVK